MKGDGVRSGPVFGRQTTLREAAQQ